jgi:hypothetical protein
VCDQQDRPAPPPELGELVEHLREASSPTARTSSTGVGIDVNRDQRTEAHVCRRIGSDRNASMKSSQLGELDDLVEAALNLALRQAEHDAVDEDVLPAGDLG